MPTLPRSACVTGSAGPRRFRHHRDCASWPVFLAVPDRIVPHPFAKRLQQHAVETQLGTVAKLLDPDPDGIVAGLGLRPIGPEHPIPPGKIEAEIAVGLRCVRGMVHAM